MKKALLALATSAALVGCGGGGSGSGASSQDTTYKKDGIYVNNTDLVVMLVDSDLPLGSVLIGDYVNNEFLVNDTHSISGNTLTTKGLSFVSPALTTYSADVEAKITFSELGATANGVLNGTNLIYSFDRAPDSVALADMLGTHTNPVDGSTWTILSFLSIFVNPSLKCPLFSQIEMSPSGERRKVGRLLFCMACDELLWFDKNWI